MRMQPSTTDNFSIEIACWYKKKIIEIFLIERFTEEICIISRQRWIENLRVESTQAVLVL